MQTILREYWYLVLVAGLCIVVLIIGLLRGEDPTTNQATPLTEAAAQQAAKEDTMRQRLETAPTAPRQTKLEKDEDAIEKHQATLAAAPNAQDTPATLSALGNLYKQRQDYTAAAQQYERIILEFPEWEAAHGIYIELATCYEHLNAHNRIQWIYQEMTRVFPEEAQEHQFALDKLGLR